MRRKLHPSSADPSPREWPKDRRFRPETLYDENIKLDQVEIHWDENWRFVACDGGPPCEHCGKLAAHIDCIIIAVDGACRGNGTPRARAAVGVLVGNTSKYNISSVLDAAQLTNQVAELTAGICGLEQALLIQSDGVRGSRLHTVVVKADSEYLVKGMTEWVFKWEENGYTSARGKPVTNASLFKRLVELVAMLNNRNVHVLFWHVLRERNQEADELANEAFDG